MKLERLSGGCDDPETCPAVYAIGAGMALVQGYERRDHGLDLPPGEAVVAVPLEVLVEAVREAG